MKIILSVYRKHFYNTILLTKISLCFLICPPFNSSEINKNVVLSIKIHTNLYSTHLLITNYLNNSCYLVAKTYEI